jgi:FkbM family methyltransferase
MSYEVKTGQGFQFLVPSADWMFAGEALQTYELYVISPFIEAVKDRHTVLDVGANIGIYAVVASPHAKRVIALDASPQNVKLIIANAALNNISNITAYPVAVSDRISLATFDCQESTNKVMFPRKINVSTIGDIDVALALPIDVLLPNLRVDVLKIDVEGREYAALNGALRILDQNPIVFSEYSPDFIKFGCDVEGTDYLRLYFSRGYSATILHRDMSREDVGQSADMIQERWQRYMSEKVTHLDLRFNPPN